jgi:hypothetical protein
MVFALTHPSVPRSPVPALPTKEGTPRTPVADAPPPPRALSIMSLEIEAIFRNHRPCVATRALHCVRPFSSYQFCSRSFFLLCHGNIICVVNLSS